MLIIIYGFDRCSMINIKLTSELDQKYNPNLILAELVHHFKQDLSVTLDENKKTVFAIYLEGLNKNMSKLDGYLNHLSIFNETIFTNKRSSENYSLAMEDLNLKSDHFYIN